MVSNEIVKKQIVIKRPKKTITKKPKKVTVNQKTINKSNVSPLVLIILLLLTFLSAVYVSDMNNNDFDNADTLDGYSSDIFARHTDLQDLILDIKQNADDIVNTSSSVTVVNTGGGDGNPGGNDGQIQYNNASSFDGAYYYNEGNMTASSGGTWGYYEDNDLIVIGNLSYVAVYKS